MPTIATGRDAASVSVIEDPKPSPTSTRSFGASTLHGPRRPRRARTAAWVALVVAAACVAVLAVTSGTLPFLRSADHRRYIGTDGWPTAGQGAYTVNGADVHESAGQQPVPIASVAKVMTAVVVLEKHPLLELDTGPSIVVSADDVRDTERRRAEDESIVEVATGESLTERQALEALLLPSANNVAAILARWAAGTVDAFVAQMNREADKLHMHHTTYTDPSGYDAATVSTASDQLRLAEVAAKIPVLEDIMSMRSTSLPVAGTARNTDTLLGHGGFVGMKTGSTDQAGGCFMFRARRIVHGEQVDVIGVVLGQPGYPGRPLYESALNAARQLVEQVAPVNP